MGISLCTLSVQEFFTGRRVASREMEIFITETCVVDPEIMRTMKRQGSNFVQQIIRECLLSGLRNL